MTPDLVDCPFCGSTEDVSYGRQGDYSFAICPTCGAQGPRVRFGSPRDKWNTRAAISAMPPQQVSSRWCGTEDEEHAARRAACKARRAQWGEDSCEEKDGSCDECTFDLPLDLPCPRKGCGHEPSAAPQQEGVKQQYLRPGFDFALAHAVEEAGEFLAAAGKTQRWGRSSVNPELPPSDQEVNEAWLCRELGGLRSALDRLEKAMREEPASSKDEARDWILRETTR